ncbi:SCUB2-like protein [Mya arenaria]|uniref:SCUB2-like protein n=1 Tax=Mya arenaria TaxID=6604 RepID=A0ABY7DIE3_MYAAR|nr:SCUB2-like protein [Mya arenaria]
MILAQGRLHSEVAHTIIVLTDGRSTNTFRTGEEAKKACEEFIRVFAVGVGRNVYRDELERIKSDADSILYVSSFMQLVSQITFLEDHMCEDSYSCSAAMDMTLIQDSQAAVSAGFTVNADDFYQAVTASYPSVFRQTFSSNAELLSRIQGLTNGMSTNPANTKLLVLLLEGDVTDQAVKDSLIAYRQAGGVVAIISSDPAIGLANFIFMATSPDHIFVKKDFGARRNSRFIARKLCITPCLDGEERMEGGECDKCKRGTYRTVTESHVCLPCGVKKTTLDMGATLNTECVPDCKAGEKMVGDSCEKCPVGSYQPELKDFCIECETDFTTANTGSAGPDDCIRSCPAGTKRSSDESSCFLCPVGTYQPEPLKDVCLECAPNLITAATSSTSPDLCIDRCNVKMDIVLVLDASSSLQPLEFTLMKGFLVNTISQYKVGPTDVRIGIIFYSNNVATSPRLRLDATVDRNLATNIASSIPQGSIAGSNMASAITEANNMINDQPRADATHYAKFIVVVAAKPSDNSVQSIERASDAKDDFIEVVSVGVGGQNQAEELASIASDNSLFVTSATFLETLNLDLLPVMCQSMFTCGASMDVFYVKDISTSTTLSSKVDTFISNMNDMYTSNSFTELTGTNLQDALTGNTPLALTAPQNTAVVVIFTDKNPTSSWTAGVQTAAADLSDKGVVIAVVYESDTETTMVGVGSNDDVVFSKNNFHLSPYDDVLFRSLCIEPCSDGAERDNTGECKECLKGSYRTATSTHMCQDCPDNQSTQGPGATSQTQCVPCSASEWQCDNGDCIDEALRCDGATNCGDNSDEDSCNVFLRLCSVIHSSDTCVAGQRYDGSTCITCEKGTYQPDKKQTLCLKCPERSTTIGPGKTSVADCSVVCDESGQELDVTSGQCVDCPAGKFRDANLHTACLPCSNGWTSPAASTSVDDCQPPCLAGEFWNTDTRACEKCVSNTFTPNPGQMSCLSCPAGTTTGPITGATSQTQCTNSYSCSAAMDMTLIQDSQAAVSAGFTVNADDFYQAVTASYPSVFRQTFSSNAELLSRIQGLTNGMSTNPANTKLLVLLLEGDVTDQAVKDSLIAYRQAGGVVAIISSDPAIGLANFIFMATSPDHIFVKKDFGARRNSRFIARKLCITPCLDGEERMEGGECDKCKRGTYRTVTESHVCLPCGVKKTTLDMGATLNTECVPDCKAGEKMVGDSCEKCPVGSYQPELKDFCIECETDFTTANTGSAGPDDCIRSCPAGTKRSSDESSCFLCPVGTYQPEPLKDVCLECAPNLITAATSSTSPDLCIDRCNVKMDIVLVLDASSSLQPLEFTLMKGFLVNTISQYKVGPTDVRIGIIFYSNNVATSPRLRLDATVDRNLATNIASSIPQGSIAGSNMASAITEANNMINDQPRADATHYAKFIVVVAAKPSDNSVQSIERASDAKDDFIEVVSVGVGGQNQAEELASIASDNSLFVTSATFLETLNLDLLPVMCQSMFTCGASMDVFYVKDISTSTTLSSKVDTFISNMNDMYTSNSFTELTGTNLQDALTGNTPLALTAPQNTAVVVIFTDKNPTSSWTAGVQTAAADLSDKGVVIAVVYESDTETTMVGVGSNDDVVFSKNNFHLSPYDDVLFRSLCIEPCSDGAERDNTGECKECLKGSYRTATSTHMCQDCPDNQSTQGPGATSQTQCVPCSASEWQCDNGDCIDEALRCDGATNCGDNSDEDSCNVFLRLCSVIHSSDTCVAGQRYDGSTCITCEKGTYQPDKKQTLCLKCPERSTTIGPGKTSVADCSVVCDESGQELDVTSGQCVDCPAGKFRDANLHTACLPCSNGWTSPAASTSVDDCQPPCLAGEFWNTDTRACEKCVSNTFTPNPGQMSCLSCPAGTTTGPITGATSQTQCTNSYSCSAAMDMTLIQDSQAAVSAGFTVNADDFYQAVTASYPSVFRQTFSSNAELLSRIQGLTNGMSTNPANTKLLVLLLEGDVTDQAVKDSLIAYRQAGGVVAIISSDPAIGLANFIFMATSPDHIFVKKDFGARRNSRFIARKLCITPCLDGEERMEGGECDKCKRGTYRTVTESHVCLPCGVKKTTLDMGATLNTECVPDCKAGEKMVGDSCEKCPVGSYQPELKDFCIECETDFTTANTGSAGPDDCIRSCPAGTKRSSDESSCFLCPVGTYQPEPLKDVCLECAPNLITAATSSTSPDLCIDRCNVKMDIVLVLDASSSLQPLEFTLMKGFLVNTISQYKVGPTDVRIGIIFYSNNVATSPRLRLDATVDRNLATNIASSIPQGSIAGSNMASAITEANNMINDQPRADATHYAKFIVVVAAKPSDNSVQSIERASDAKDDFIEVVSVGVGGQNQAEELASIASDNSLFVTSATFLETLNLDLLPVMCQSMFTCGASMDVFYVKDISTSTTLSSKVDTFISNMNDMYTSNSFTELTGTNLQDALTGNTPLALTAPQNTAVVVIFTDKNPTSSWTAGVQTAAADLSDKGVVIAVVYESDTETTMVGVGSNDDVVFSKNNFHLSPYDDVLFRSLCIEPCSDGAERDNTGECKECLKGSYRTATSTHMCQDCPDNQSTQGPGATSQTQCVPCSASEWQCDNGDCIDEALRCDGATNCGDNSDEDSCNTCVAGQRYDGSTCITCEKGTYQPDKKQTLCLKCPERSTTIGPGKTSVADCSVVCDESGQELDVTSGQCVDCPAGKFRDANLHTACLPCSNGWTSPAASTSVDDCQPPCLAGEFWNTDTRACEKCVSNTFTPNPGQMSCLSCPAGTTTGPITGATSQTQCTNSYSCSAAMDMTLIQDSQAAVSAGFTVNADDFYQAVTASYPSVFRQTFSSNAELLSRIQGLTNGMSTNPANTKLLVLLLEGDVTDQAVKDSLIAYRQAGGVVAIISSDPAIGLANFIFMATSPDHIFVKKDFGARRNSRFIARKLCITPCLDGEERMEGGECDKCKRGTYRTVTESHVCLPCGVKKTTLDMGATLNTECVPDCKAGEKMVGDSCEKCPVGSYQPELKDFCIECETDFTTANTGSAGPDDCIRSCPAGTKRSSDESSCFLCPVGTYQPEPLKDVCLECAPNLITAATSSTSPDLCIDRCNVKMDIVLVLDASSSLQPLEFTLMKGFLVNTISQYKVGPTDVRIGIIFYSNNVATSPRLRLDATVDRNLATNIASSIPQGSIAGSNMASAITEANNMINDQPRADATHYAKFIVVVAAKPSDNSVQSIERASDAKDDFIEVVSVGVGGQNQAEELASIASDNSLFVTSATFLETLNLDLLPVMCQSMFTCGASMDVFYVKDISTSTTLSSKVDTFISNMNDMYTSNSFTELTGTNLQDALTGNTPLALTAPQNTAVVVIFTDKNPTSSWTAGVQTAAADLSDKGVVIAVVYESDTETTMVGVGSNDDVVFSKNNFHLSPYDDVLFRSLCIEPCSDGAERDNTGECKECLKGSYRTATSTHMCQDCPDNQSTQGPGATSQTQCVPCSASEWQCDNGDCIDEALRCDGATNCGDNSDEDSCNTCVAGQRYDGSTCITCEKGTYQPDKKQTLCLKCPERSTTIGPGKTSVADCSVVCDESGQELDVTSGQCVDCPAGKFRDANLHTACLPCSNGWTSPAASTSVDDCQPPCLAGEFWNTDTRACEKCVSNTFTPNPGQMSCLSCPAGTTTGPITGATSQTQCTNVCADGFYLPEGMTDSTSCTACPTNTIKVSPDTICKPCQSGYISEDGLTCIRRCLECTFGTYQPLDHANSCITCPQGTTTNEQGSTDSIQCIVPCDGGKYLAANGSCVPCLKGEIRPADKTTKACSPCPNGQTTTSPGSTSCVLDCKAGSYNTGTNCDPCPQGLYSEDDLATSCDPCPLSTSTLAPGANSNSMCVDPCASGQELTEVSPIVCTSCPLNTYKTYGQDARCVDCPDGFITPADAATSKDSCLPNCSPGKFYDESSDSCQSCPANMFQDEHYKKSCKQCRKGWTSPTGSDDVSDCGPVCVAGSYWSEDLTPDPGCVECAEGSAQPLANQLQCDLCPTGLTTNGPGQTQCIVSCTAGKFYNSLTQECDDCPPNTYSGAGQLTCDPCDIGKSSPAGSDSQDDCIYSCSIGSAFNLALGRCVSCVIGYYQDVANQLTCKKCTPLGYTTLDYGSEDAGDCVAPCEAGQYQSTNGTCLSCPEGTSSTTAGSQCVECPDGEQWNLKTPECEPCPVDKYKGEGQMYCHDCPSRYTTSGVTGSTDITACKPECTSGQFFNIISYECENCLENTYQDEDHMTSCKDCPPGTQYTGTGATSSSQCIAIICGPGTYRDGTGHCTDCSKGSYSNMPNQLTCTKCGAGLTTPDTASKSSFACFIPCDEGYDWDASLEMCVQCDKDSYRGKEDSPTCIPCKYGFQTATKGATRESDCKAPCNAGTVYNRATFVCIPCPVGTFQPNPHMESCSPCPKGTTHAVTGATSPDLCQDPCAANRELQSDGSCYPCPTGSIKPEDETVCRECQTDFTTFDNPDLTTSPYKYECDECDNGLTTPTDGATNRDQCYDKCPDGFELTFTGTCESCPKNYYKATGDTSQCVACPDDLITLFSGADSLNKCVRDCDVGTYWDGTDCVDCAKGSYQDKLYQTSCVNCIAGYTTPTFGSESDSDCFDPCADGRTWDGEECVACGLNRYRDRTNQNQCQDCDAGLVTVTDTAITDADCKANCQKGSYFDFTDLECKECPVGKFQALPNQYHCEDCPPGKTTDAIASDSEQACIDVCDTPGQVLEPGGTSADDCVDCPKGSYHEGTICLQCPQGETTETTGSLSQNFCILDCKAGEERSADGSMCVPCPKDKYQTEADRIDGVCKPCPTGKDNCPAGSFYSSLSQKCEVCPAGKYQSMSLMESCDSCPSWKTTLQPGATSRDQCVDACGSGYEFDGDVCDECPRGEFRTENVHDECQPCDDQHTTLATASTSKNDCVPICSPGTYYNSISQACAQCEEGTYNPEPYQSECPPCPADKPLSMPHRLSCRESCEAGKFYRISSGTCVPCPQSTYNNMVGQESCKPCPDGKHTNGEGKTNVLDCRLDWCDAGYLYVDATRSCVPCGVGLYRSDSDATCQQCPDGKTTITPTASSVTHCVDAVGPVSCQGGNIFNTTSGRLRINDHDTHVAIILYARGVRTLTDLQSGCRLQRVVACLDRQLDVSRYNIVNTGFALHRVKEVFSRSGRRNVRKHLLLISDDSSRNPAMSLHKADLLKRAGVGITFIGSDATEVSRIASSSRNRLPSPDTGQTILTHNKHTVYINFEIIQEKIDNLFCHKENIQYTVIIFNLMIICNKQNGFKNIEI